MGVFFGGTLTIVLMSFNKRSDSIYAVNLLANLSPSPAGKVAERKVTEAKSDEEMQTRVS